MLVVFCGTHFPAGFEYTKQFIGEITDSIEVIQSDDASTLSRAQVLVPFMTPITESLINSASDLRLVIQFGVGLEGVDIPAATRKGVLVGKIPSTDTGNAQSCAEHAIFLALGLLRDFNGLQLSIKQQRLGFPLGRTLFKAQVAIVGYGGIGRALVPRLLAFQASVTVVRRAVSEEDISTENLKFLTLADFLSTPQHCEVVFLACPPTPSAVSSTSTSSFSSPTPTTPTGSKPLVDSGFLSVLPDGVVLVNVARGGLLDYHALEQALGIRENESGVRLPRLGGLGMDVFVPEPIPQHPAPALLAHPLVLCTPHVAGVTRRSYENMGREMAQRIAGLLLDGRTPDDIVNLHDIAASRQTS